MHVTARREKRNHATVYVLRNELMDEPDCVVSVQREAGGYRVVVRDAAYMVRGSVFVPAP